MKILIVGAGPTGLTTALELGRNGITPTIVDAKDEPSTLSRAVGILPRSIDILSRTGVSENILKEGLHLKKMHIQRGQKTLINLDIEKYLHGKDFLILLPQNRTESIMAEKLSEMGITVAYGVKVSEIVNNDTDATVTFSDGHKETYDWVVGADGINSTVRTQAGIPFLGYELDEDWSIADVELSSGFDDSLMQAWLLKGERNERDACLMLPIAENRVRIVSSTPDSLKALPIKLDIKNVRRSGDFRIPIKQAEQYVKGRIVLAGDAAHSHSPVGGRGMNLGIEDASSLVEHLLAGTMNTYEKERIKKGKAVIRGTEFARKLLVSNNIFVIFATKVVAFSVTHVPFVRKKFFERLGRL